ncbi:hypothetical protein Q3C01_05515 [Bradyrhizobium sp. UFLA05-109]
MKEAEIAGAAAGRETQEPDRHFSLSATCASTAPTKERTPSTDAILQFGADAQFQDEFDDDKDRNCSVQ